MWFEKLTGFTEASKQQVQENLILEGETIRSRQNGKTYTCGSLSIPNLSKLRKTVESLALPPAKLTLQECVADVQALHKEEVNAGSLFQVASQFNLLEMPSPNVTPEQGLADYEHDHTQGPACAIAAGAGTL
ncbi:MAG: hypothetical protein KAG34_00080 [Cocleimonas sp.]|nr:hypothetical protein [Cocleimonas sp.]